MTFKAKITRKEYESMKSIVRGFIDFLTIQYHWYTLDDNYDYVLTDLGKRESNYSDYLHGLDQAYEGFYYH